MSSSKKTNKKSFKKGKPIKSNLNANATEFVPATAAANIQEFTNAASPPPFDYDEMQYFKNDCNDPFSLYEATANLMPDPRQEYAQAAIPSMCLVPTYNNSSCNGTNVNDVDYSQRLEYQTFAIPLVDHEENFNCGGYGPRVNNLVCHQRPEYAQSLYSFVDPMQHFDMAHREPAEQAVTYQGGEYTNLCHPVCPSMVHQPPMGLMHNFDIGGPPPGCEPTTNAISGPHWQGQLIPTSRPAPEFYVNQESHWSTKPTGNFFTVDDFFTCARLTNKYGSSNAMATPLYNNNLKDNTTLLACDHRALENSLIAKNNFNRETKKPFFLGDGLEPGYTDIPKKQFFLGDGIEPEYTNEPKKLQVFLGDGIEPESADRTKKLAFLGDGIEPVYTELNATATALCLPNENNFNDNTHALACDNKEITVEGSVMVKGNNDKETTDSVDCTEPEHALDMATGATPSCLPDGDDLKDTTSVSSGDHKETVAESSPTTENNEIKGSIDSKDTNEDNNGEISNDESVPAKAATEYELCNDIEEQAKPVVNLKNNKKKNRASLEKICSIKEHVNIVFIGHVDAGKSTLGGHLMYLTGMIDKRTMDKYQKEAKEKSRQTWYLSWAMDTNEEERDKGKTVETGRGYFETDTKHFTILDAPGHKSFVPNMICGAAQADIGVLVLSARLNEFESGFDKGGQTKDHAMLVKSAGIGIIIVLVNKMDDATVQWDEKRYNYCRDKTLPFLKKIGYAVEDLHFMPVSGQTGEGLLTAVSKTVCPWFEGPSLIEYLNMLSPITRKVESPFVMPVVERYRDMGTVVMGKIEAGSTSVSKSLLLMPNKVKVSVEKIWSDDKEVTSVKAGENVKFRLKGVEDDEISPGFVLCDIENPVPTTTEFDAQINILDCKSIICLGYSAVMHMHSIAEVVTITRILKSLDPTNNRKVKARDLKFVKKYDEAVMRLQCSGVICLTVYEEFSPLGRFSLREDNKVIAIGIVVKIDT